MLNPIVRISKKKYSNTKFQGKPSSEGRIIRSGGTETKKDKTKLTVAVRSFAKAPKKGSLSKDVTRPKHEAFPNISMGLRTTGVPISP